MQGYIHLPTLHSCLPRIYRGELLSQLFPYKRTSLWTGDVFLAVSEYVHKIYHMKTNMQSHELISGYISLLKFSLVSFFIYSTEW